MVLSSESRKKRSGSYRLNDATGGAMSAVKPEIQLLKELLVAMDFTPESDKAFDFAIKLLQNNRQAQLYILHAVTTHVMATSETAPDALLINMQIQDKLVKEAKERMEEKVNYAKAHGVSRVKGIVVVSDPVRAILQAAKDIKADMILLGNRRRGYTRGILFGSVSARVAADSPASVLIVR